MSQKIRYEFDSLHVDEILDSPDLPEILDALLTLYRSTNRNNERLEETVQSLLNRIYGPKSEKSKYHETQKVLAPEFLEDAEAMDDDQPDEPIDASDVAKDDDDEEKPPKRKTKRNVKALMAVQKFRHISNAALLSGSTMMRTAKHATKNGRSFALRLPSGWNTFCRK